METVKKLEEMLELLQSGKKVLWDMNYIYPAVPIVRVSGKSLREQEHGRELSDLIPLDCIPYSKFDTYLPELMITLEELSVCGYETSECSKIKYIFSNPQMNRVFAVLENGHEVDYTPNVIDLWHAFKGEYVEET